MNLGAHHPPSSSFLLSPSSSATPPDDISTTLIDTGITSPSSTRTRPFNSRMSQEQRAIVSNHDTSQHESANVTSIAPFSPLDLATIFQAIEISNIRQSLFQHVGSDPQSPAYKAAMADWLEIYQPPVHDADGDACTWRDGGDHDCEMEEGESCDDDEESEQEDEEVYDGVEIWEDQSEDEMDYDQDEVACYLGHYRTPSLASGSDVTSDSVWSGRHADDEDKPRQVFDSESSRSCGFRKSFEIERFTLEDAKMEGEESSEEDEKDGMDLNPCGAFPEDMSGDESILAELLEEHVSIIPPADAPRTTNYDQTLLATTDNAKNLQLSFEQIRKIDGGCGTSTFAVVRSVGEHANELGIQGERLWVLKLFKIQEVRQPRSEVGLNLRKEIAVYQRIAEASKLRKEGFRFLMSLEASITTQDSIGLVMGLMSFDLHDLLESQRGKCQRLPKNCVRRITAQIAVGLATLHSIGVIHCDLKPSNVLIDERENVKLADFGISYVAWDCIPLLARKSYIRQYAGTVGYNAPEKAGHCPRYGCPVDYWALGCIFFEMSTGKDIDWLMLETLEELGNWISRFYDIQDRKEELSRRVHEGALNEQELDILCGLLDPDYTSRYGIEDLLQHHYFLMDGADGIDSEFSKMKEKSLENLLPAVDPPKCEEAQSSEGPFVTTNLSNNTKTSGYEWVNPYGAFAPLWKHP